MPLPGAGPPGLAWRGLALHGVALPGVALLWMASPGVALPVVVPCWYPFLVEHRRWIIHLMEFQLEFLLDHMLVVSLWYVLLVKPSSCNLHEGTLFFLFTGGLIIASEG